MRHEAEIKRNRNVYLPDCCIPSDPFQTAGDISISEPQTLRLSAQQCATTTTASGLLESRWDETTREKTPTDSLSPEEHKKEMHSRIHTRLTNTSRWVYLTMENTNFTHGSGSTNETDVKTEMALPIFMFAGGAIGNLIAIIVLSVSRQERKSSAFYTLVCGLAVTDLLGTCLASPLIIANYLDQHVLQYRHVCEFQSFLLLFFGLTGLSIICAMAAERYMAICCPYTYQRWGVDRRFAQKFLFFIYTSHILFCCLPMVGMASSQLQKSKTWCFIDWKTEKPVAAAAYSILYGVVSLLLILGTIVLNLAVCAALLLMRQRTMQRTLTRASVRERWRALSTAAETQMIAVLVMTSVVVLACSAPLVVRLFANRFMPHNDDADLAAIRIASVNPILDPWIYILLRRSLFRRLLSLSSRGSSTRSSSPPSPQRNLFYPELMADSHVFTQLMFNANIITQLPATVKFTQYDTEGLRHT